MKPLLILGIALAGALPALAGEVDYRAEIDRSVVTPCIKDVVKRQDNLPRSISTDEMVDLIKAVQSETWETVVDKLMPLIQGKSKDVRKKVYEVGLKECIYGSKMSERP